MYLTFDEYAEMGGKLQETVYARFEYKARRAIDAATRGRIAEEVQARESVKHLMYELIALYATVGPEDGVLISSASADGFSENYVVRTEQELQQEADKLVNLYLSGETTESGVPLLYSGVC